MPRRMLGAIIVFGVIVFGVMIAACSGSGSAKAPTTSAPTTTTAGTAASLQGPLWSDLTVGPLAVPPSITVTASFRSGTVSGSSGCNSYSASYTVDGQQLTIGSITRTKAACDPPAMAVEKAYVAALPKVRAYSISTSGALELMMADGKLLTYLEQKQTVVGAWKVTAYLRRGANALTSVIPGTTVTATFATDGTVSGSGGCNGYTGSYAMKGAAISIGPLGSTLKLCAEPNGVSSQEADFLAAMQGAKAFTVAGNELTLLASRNRRAVTMQRAGSQ